MLARVHERARETRAEVDVVRAAGPLEALGRRAAHRPVAAAVVELAGRAGARERVSHAGRRDGVDERRLPSAFSVQRHRF